MQLWTLYNYEGELAGVFTSEKNAHKAVFDCAGLYSTREQCYAAAKLEGYKKKDCKIIGDEPPYKFVPKEGKCHFKHVNPDKYLGYVEIVRINADELIWSL